MRKITLKSAVLTIDGKVIGEVEEAEITLNVKKSKPKIWSVS